MDRQWLPEYLTEVALLTLASHCFQTDSAKQKGHGEQKDPYTTAKDKMCETRTSISELMSFFVTTPAIIHLHLARAVVSKKLIQ